MQLFTYLDHLNGACFAAEIGTPWKARWSRPDAAMGFCDQSQVGTDKPVSPVGEAEPAAPLSKAERRALLRSMADKIIKHAEAHPAAMLDDNGAQINKLLDIFTKMDEREEEDAGSGPLARLSAATLPDYRRANGALYAALIEAMGRDYVIPEKLEEFHAFVGEALERLKR